MRRSASSLSIRIGREGGNCHYHVHPQLLYRTHGSCSLVLDNFLHIGFFAFFALFVRYRSVSCSFIYIFTPPVIIIMETASPTAQLSILSCILITSLAVFLPLLWAYCRSFSIHWLGSQTCIFGFKSVFDLVRVILLALDISEVILLHNGKLTLV